MRRELWSASFVARALVRTGARAALAPLPLIHRDLDSRTHEKSARATVQVRVRSGKALELEVCTQFHSRRHQSVGDEPAWPSWSLARLLLRDSALKMRFTVIDAVPNRTLTPLLDAIRARSEMCLLCAHLDEEMACCRRVCTERCMEL